MPKGKDQKTRTTADNLVKAGKKGSIELTESDLKKVAGGLKINTIKGE